MKKILLFSLVMLFSMAFCVTSCSNDDDSMLVSEVEEVTPLGEMIGAIIGEPGIENNIVLLKCETDGSYELTLYDVSAAVNKISVTRSERDLCGWHFAGHVSNKLEAVRIANKLSKELIGDQVILIKLVPTTDGGWDVYWKYE